MINVSSILAGTHIPVRKTKHQDTPPGGTYIVWFDTVALDGPDLCPALLKRHTISVQLYERQPDERAERTLETAFDAAGLNWSRGDRDWAEEEQHYIVLYTFSFFEKRR